MTYNVLMLIDRLKTLAQKYNNITIVKLKKCLGFQSFYPPPTYLVNETQVTLGDLINSKYQVFLVAQRRKSLTELKSSSQFRSRHATDEATESNYLYPTSTTFREFVENHQRIFKNSSRAGAQLGFLLGRGQL